jgi:DHA1 family tetracycline resistance protein-like MFS transporter
MSGSQQIAQAAISDISTENNRVKNMGLVTLTISVGLIVGPLIGGITSDKNINHFFNFATPFFITAFLPLLASCWLYFGFDETFQLIERKKFNLTQYIKDFSYINSHKPLRLLTIIFLLFQIGFGLFFSLIFSLLHHEFNYTSWQLGAFNAFLGLNFVIGMLLLGNILMKRLSPKKLATLCILILGISQILIVLIHSEHMTWLLISPLAMFDIVGYTVLLSLFGKVAPAEKQGWVMGISGSLSACSYILTGFSPNLLNIFNERMIILFGGILILSSIFLVKKFYEHHNS